MKLETDVIAMARIANSLKKDVTSKKDMFDWTGSPFAWIKEQPSRRIGKIGELMVEKWCRDQKFEVTQSPDSEADRVIAGIRVEVKLSTLWQKGYFKFQQIRDQNYDAIWLLGVGPGFVRNWLVPKSIVQSHVIGKLGQHTGSEGAETAWLSIIPGQEPDWIKPYGSSLSVVYRQLRLHSSGKLSDIIY